MSRTVRPGVRLAVKTIATAAAAVLGMIAVTIPTDLPLVVAAVPAALITTVRVTLLKVAAADRPEDTKVGPIARTLLQVGFSAVAIDAVNWPPALVPVIAAVWAAAGTWIVERQTAGGALPLR